MKGLIYLFLRYGGFITFVFLEAICFFIIVNANDEQAEIFDASYDNAVGVMSNQVSDLNDFINLSSVADSVSKENTRLYEILVNANLDPDVFQTDTLRGEDDAATYVLTSARVVSNSTNKFNNYIQLNKGAKDGIKKHQGVISSKGVIGIVRGVSENYAVAMSLLHSQTRISAAIKRGGDFGSLYWGSTNTREVYLDGIPKDKPLLVGDTVVTSGFSSKFPPGIMIGTVSDFSLEEGSNSYDIKVRLTERFANLDYVHVVNNLHMDERIELLESVERE